MRRQIPIIKIHRTLAQSTSTPHVKQCHANLISSGHSSDTFASNNLINAYTFFKHFNSAEAIFHRLVDKNVVSWTILISGYVKVGLFFNSIELFREMVMSGIKLNAVSLSSVLPAIGNLRMRLGGKAMHGHWVRFGFGSNVFVETGLIDMYGKFGMVGDARKVFDGMCERNVVTCNVIVSVHAENGFGLEAVQVFRLMRRSVYGFGIGVDCFTIVSLVSACSSFDDTRFGDGIHGFVIRAGLVKDALVETSLLQFYVNVSRIDEASMVFDEICVKDVVVWTLMLNGLARVGYYKKAREYFLEMMSVEDMKLDYVVYMAVLSGCRDSGALMLGRRIHAMIMKTGFEFHVYLASSLIDMYSNCGDLQDSCKIFEGVDKRDVVCWNTMIHGYGVNGLGDEALELFSRMRESNVCPDESTVVQILSACSHAGKVSEGLEIFSETVRNKTLVLKPEHYACVVDLLGRAGKLSEALSFINEMPMKPTSCVYGALFGACKTHEDFKLGVETAKQLLESEAADSGFYLLLLNILSQVGNWTDVDKIQTELKSRKLAKDPGFSSVELNHEVHMYTAGGTECPQFTNIHDVLNALSMQSRMPPQSEFKI